jgi:hypothetical protein
MNRKRIFSGVIASSILSSAGKPCPTYVHQKDGRQREANRDNSSLEKEPQRRATPWRMLEHPWMVEMRSKRVNMEKYLSQVWGWDEAETKS